MKSRRFAIVLAVAALAGALAGAARADIGAPVSIRIAGPRRPAIAAQVFDDSLVIKVSSACVLTNPHLQGQGWTILEFNAPPLLQLATGDSVKIRFRAVPADPAVPIELAVDWINGTEAFPLDLSPRAYERRLHPGGVLRVDRAGLPVPAPGFVPARTLGPGPGPDGPVVAPRSEPAHVTGGRVIRVHGGFMYKRSDGVTMPADGMGIQIYDEDTGPDELLATGITGVDGMYDISFTWDPCYLCDGKPDLYVKFVCSNAAADVRPDKDDDAYSWETGTVGDYTGSDLDEGVLMPDDPGEHPAVHILTTATRAWRWLHDNEGFFTPKITYSWPEGINAAYHGDYIHISTGRSWNEDTFIHEFTHHWVEVFAVRVDPFYCNGYCDPPGGSCGHCMWCQETDHDAWSEGFPNWVADVITRSFEADYGRKPLFFRDQETPAVCPQTLVFNDPTLTEGFLGALLRDIEDAASDDHFPTDPWKDALALGTHPIFQVAHLDGPTTPMDFLAKFRARYPSTTENLWETAKNCRYEIDTAPPGLPTAIHSTSHSIGLDSADPRVKILWTHPTDDASGVWGYSFTITPTASDAGTTRILGNADSVTTGYLSPGTYWLNLRTQDRSGKWAVGSASIGPFIIRAPEPANLAFINPFGWDNVIVPRASGDATPTTAHLPAELPGNTADTWWNFSGVNNGETATAMGFDTDLWMDGINPGSSVYKVGSAAMTEFQSINLGPLTVPGGRHTMGVYLDSHNALAEPIETDNEWADQYVWSPLALTAGVVTTRPPPPEPTGGWDGVVDGSTLFFNSDGLRFNAGPAWNAVDVWCTNTKVDDDLRLHVRSTSPTVGFDLLSGNSSRPPGCVDAVIVNGHQSGFTGSWDVGVVATDGPNVGYAARQVTSVPVAVADSVTVTMGSDDYVLLREIYISPDKTGPVTVWIETSPPRRVTAEWLDAGFAAGGLSDYSVRAITGTDGRGRIDAIAPNAGYYCVALFRDPRDFLPPPPLAVAAQPAGEAQPVSVLAPSLDIGLKALATSTDLGPFAAQGWHAPLVPRPLPDGGPNGAPAPGTLDGNTPDTYLNVAAINLGATPTGAFGGSILLDGAALESLPFASLPANSSALVNESTPRTVRGGRHTLTLQLDPLDQVLETDETNNAYGEQWVWSPLGLGPGASVTRSAPPDPIGGWNTVATGEALWLNSDGLRALPLAQGGSDWIGIAAMPGPASDVDVTLHEAAPDTKSGFAEPLAFSGWGPGQSDFVLVNFTSTVVRPFDVGIVSSGGSESYTAEMVGSTFRGNNPSGTYGPYALGAGRILDLHEFILTPGRWRFTLQNLAAPVDWGMSLHPWEGSFFGKSSALPDGIAWLGVAGELEELLVDVPTTGPYALAVWKVAAADLALGGQYRLFISGNATAVPPAGGPTATAFYSARPNPFAGGTTLDFALAGSGEVDLAIYDISGARVRTIAHGTMGPGRHAEAWNGEDDRGRPVVAGIYLVRFTAPHTSLVRKLVRVR